MRRIEMTNWTEKKFILSLARMISWQQLVECSVLVWKLLIMLLKIELKQLTEICGWGWRRRGKSSCDESQFLLSSILHNSLINYRWSFSSFSRQKYTLIQKSKKEQPIEVEACRNRLKLWRQSRRSENEVKINVEFNWIQLSYLHSVRLIILRTFSCVQFEF